MINNYIAKKENGLIAYKTLENGNIEITESKYNELTGKKEFVTTYTTNESHMESLVTDYQNQVDMATTNLNNIKALQADLGYVKIENK